MLANQTAIATIAVKNLPSSRKFYEGKLGLTPKEIMGEEGAITYEGGSGSLLVYQSQFAGGYGATVATWIVGGELASIVKDLKNKGISFEHYEMPDMTLNGDIHVDAANDMQVAWFKDPDGNIICLASG